MECGTDIEFDEQHSKTAFLNGHQNQSKNNNIKTIQNEWRKSQNILDENDDGSNYDLNSLCALKLKVPWIIVLVSTIQLVVFFVACDNSAAMLVFKPHRKYELWRFLSYSTLHYSTTHLLLNITLQILIGYQLEIEQGHFRVSIVYLFGIVFGAIGSMYFKSAASIIGSSAAIYSLLFSHISQCILNWDSISNRCFRLFAVLMLLAGDLLFSTLKQIFWNNVKPDISIAAHLSGGISGLFTGLVIFKKIESNSAIDL